MRLGVGDFGEANFGQLSVGAGARRLVDPARRWAGAAIYDGGALAYLVLRELSDDVDELGIMGNGPGSELLMAKLHHLLRQWIEERLYQPIVTARREDTSPAASPTANQIVRPHTVATICW